MEYLTQLKDKEIANSEKQIALNNHEIEKLEAQYESLISVDNVAKLEQTLVKCQAEKKNLSRVIKDLELEHLE